MIAESSIYFGGFQFVDQVRQVLDFSPLVCDLAIIVVGWESRSYQLLEHGLVKGRACILVSFDGDGIEESERERFSAQASLHFEGVLKFQCSSPLDAQMVMSDTERLAGFVSGLHPSVCAVDYSSMPKVVTQTLFRQFMIEGVCPRVHWIYSSGLYDDTPVVSDEFNQGAADFFSIRGAEGNGGISSQKVAVLALGADRTLISSFLRSSSYDITHFLDAASTHSPKLAQRIKEQRLWLQAECGIGYQDFLECDAKSVVGTLKILLDLIKRFPEEDGAAVDLFCSGPKSQAIAASALVSSFRNVRLVGRVPHRYLKIDVRPTQEISVTSVTDYTNPLIVHALTRG